jgi:glycosyltransferase involved in cell wall biosynthesis
MSDVNKNSEEQTAPSPKVSVVIPVYNEEGIINEAIEELVSSLDQWGPSYEVIIAENGSRDQTVELAERLSERFPHVSTFSVGEPNYGLALKRGLLRARGEYAICDEIDLCDTQFYRAAFEVFDGDSPVDFIVGSKRAPGARDRRPLFRRFATGVLNGMLRVSVGFKGTDTHGLKALKLSAVTPVVESCVVDKDMFASELVVRVHRSSLSWLEIPIDLQEKRPPSVHLLRRVPNVLKNILRLVMIIRFGRDL